MKEIPLSQGQVALVDDEDFERVSRIKWCARWHPDINSYRVIGYIKRPGNKRCQIYMSRYIMKTPNGLECDHINHNPLDNRKSNLRNCTHSQNQCNKGPTRFNKLGHKNISRHKIYGYAVNIEINDKRFRKWFKTLDDAIKARDEFLIKYHGEFAFREKSSPHTE